LIPPIFYLHSSLKIEPQELYTIRAYVVKKNDKLSDYSEVIHERTMKEDPMMKPLHNPNLKDNVKSLIQKLRDKIKETNMNNVFKITMFKYVVFGDVGAGKSSFLNTLSTAFTEDDYYVDKFTTGKSEKSTTLRVADKPIGKCFQGTDLPGLNVENYNMEKIHKILEGRIPYDLDLDTDTQWVDKILPFDVANMVHVVFFVVPANSLLNQDVQVRYKKMKEIFKSYKDKGLEGYEPFLIITKGDLLDPTYDKDKRKIYDDSVLAEGRKIFCSATSIDESRALFLANYKPGIQFERDVVVDFTVLFAVNAAITQAENTLESMGFWAKKNTTPTKIPTDTTRSPYKPSGPSKICPKGHSPEESGNGNRCQDCGSELVEPAVPKASTNNKKCPMGHPPEVAGNGKRCQECGKELEEPPPSKKCPKGHPPVLAGNGNRCQECGELLVVVKRCPKGHSPEESGNGNRCQECGEVLK